MMTSNDGNQINTLDLRRKQKIDKYHNLINDCKQQFNCETDFFVIIVSSLGAIPNDTINDLKKITNLYSDWKRLAKSFVMAALRESMFLYLNWRPQSDHVDKDDNDNNDESDINDASDNNDNFDVNDLNLTEHNSDVDVIIDSTESVSMNTLDDNSWIDLIGDESQTHSVSTPTVHDDISSYSDDRASDSDSDVLANDPMKPYWNSQASTSDQNSPAEPTRRSASPSSDGIDCE